MGDDAYGAAVVHVGLVPGIAVLQRDSAFIEALAHGGGELDGLGVGEVVVGGEDAAGAAVDEAALDGAADVIVVPGALGHVGEGELGRRAHGQRADEQQHGQQQGEGPFHGITFFQEGFGVDLMPV